MKPDESQQAKLEQIFDDVRQKMTKVRDMAGESDRRKQVERIRAESRARIGEILTAEQKKIYERLLGEMGGRGASGAGRVWMMGDEGQPRPVDVRTGLTDGTSTEIVEGPLQEGAEVILGFGETAAAKKAGGAPGPRMF